MSKVEIKWLEPFAQSWTGRVEQGRAPHAVLLSGPVGVGKRAAAIWMASGRLGIGAQTALPLHPAECPEHADLRWIAPLEDKQTISVDQIRDLVAVLNLTSYTGDGKVAIIAPANSMTDSAANSLLKTLEEPPGDTLIILIADRAGRLPATIFSRCQRIEISPPDEGEALAWLDRLQPGAAWAEALGLAGNAPLAALGALQQLDTHATMSRDFSDVASGRISALDVAAKWVKLDTAFVLDWLVRQVQYVISAVFTGRNSRVAAAIDDSVLKRMDRRNLFCYLDTINRLRGQPAGSYNVHLTLERLLIDWAESLKNCGQDPIRDNMWQLLVERP